MQQYCILNAAVIPWGCPELGSPCPYPNFRPESVRMIHCGTTDSTNSGACPHTDRGTEWVTLVQNPQVPAGGRGTVSLRLTEVGIHRVIGRQQFEQP